MGLNMSEYSLFIEAGSAVAIFGYFRFWMGRELNEIKGKLDEKVSEKLCLERSSKCSAEKCKKIENNKAEIADLTKDIFHHGHKGLDGTDNAVISTR